MLYDNALLAALYLRAAQVLNHADYSRVGRETLDFMLLMLGTPEGGFAASLSAVDAEGIEGGDYLWRRETLQQLLPAEELAAVEKLWQLDRASPFEAGYLPPALPAGIEAGPVASAYARLRAQRKGHLPPRDGKRIAAWNGLALVALSRGAMLDGGEGYRQAAGRLRDYLVATFWDGNRVYRAAGAQGRLPQPGTLEDYAHVAAGLWAWQQVTGEPDRLLPQLIAEAWRRFHLDGEWRFSEDTSLALPVASGVLEDGALPSPVAQLLGVSLHWAADARDEGLHGRALAALEQLRPRLAAQPFRSASWIALLEERPP